MPRKNEPQPGTIGYRIRQLREDLDLSQEELAKLVNSNKNTISLVESGKQDLYTRQVEEYAKALKTSVYFLITGIHPENTQIAQDLDLTDHSISFLRKVRKDSQLEENGETVFFINEFKYVIDALTHNPRFTCNLFNYLTDSFKNLVVNDYDPIRCKRSNYSVRVKNILNFPYEDMEPIFRLSILDELKTVRDNYRDEAKRINNNIIDYIESISDHSNIESLAEAWQAEEVEDDPPIDINDVYRIAITKALEGENENGND